VTRLGKRGYQLGAKIGATNQTALEHETRSRRLSRVSLLNCKKELVFSSTPQKPTMPHSVPDQDTVLADNETNDGETQTTSTLTAEATGNGDSQVSEAMDEDMTMAEAGVEGAEILVKAEDKSEVRLEDLFADMESDEEFPSSNVKEVKVSSSPEAPSSPV
jgi:hypothetical protein